MDSLRHRPRRRCAVGLTLVIAAAAAIAPAVAQIQQLNFAAPPNQGVVSASAQTSGARGGVIYYYWVVAQFSGGGVLPASPAIVTDAPTALSSNNKVTVRWTPAAGASSYDLLRTNSPVLPATSCTCAVATGVSGTSQDDTGAGLNSYTLSLKPAATGSIRLDNSGSAPAFSFSPSINVSLGLGTAANENVTAVIADNGAGGLTIGAGQITNAMASGITSLPSANVATATTLQSTAQGTLRPVATIGGPNNWSNVDNLAPWFGLNFSNNFDFTTLCGNGTCWPYANLALGLNLPSGTNDRAGFAALEIGTLDNNAYIQNVSGAATSGIRMEGFAGADNAGIWSWTSQMQSYDRAYNAVGAVLHPVTWMEAEFDTINDSASSGNVSALHLVGHSTQQATRYSAIQVESFTGNTCGPASNTACVPWKQAINIVAGSSSVAMLAGPTAAAVSQASIPIQFAGEDSSGTIRIAALQSDQNGGLFYSAPNNGVSTTLAAAIQKIGTGNLLTVGSVGNTSIRGALYSQATRTGRSDGTSQAWTAAQLIVGQGGQIDETPTASGLTFTTPTAAQIVAQMTTDGVTCYSGQTSFFSTIRNLSPTYSFLIAGGTGVTLSSAGGGTSIGLNPQQNLNLQGIITNCSGGSESVAIYEQGNTSAESTASSQGGLDTLTAATIGTTETGFATVYPIPANWFSQNRLVRVTWAFDETTSATPVSQAIKVRLGASASCSGAGCTGTTVFAQSTPTTPSANLAARGVIFQCWFQGTGAPGASVNLRTICGGPGLSPTTPFGVANTNTTLTAVATNAQQNIVVTMTYGGSTAGNQVTMTLMNVEFLN